MLDGRRKWIEPMATLLGGEVHYQALHHWGGWQDIPRSYGVKRSFARSRCLRVCCSAGLGVEAWGRWADLARSGLRQRIGREPVVGQPVQSQSDRAKPKGADLPGAKLLETELVGTGLAGASLCSSDLLTSKLDDTILERVTFNAILPGQKAPVFLTAFA